MGKIVNIRFDKEHDEYWIYACSEWCAPKDFKSPYTNKIVLELELMKAELVCATMLAEYFHPDTIVVKNNNGMYAIFNTFVSSWQYGAVYIAMHGAFRYKNVYGFRQNLSKGYLLLQDEFDKWGVVALLHTDEVISPFQIHEEIVPFKYDSMDEAINVAGPLFTINHMLEAFDNFDMYGPIGNLCSPFLKNNKDRFFFDKEIGE